MLSASLQRLWHKLGSPRWFVALTDGWVTALGWISLVLLIWGAVWGLGFAPADYQQGNSFRIMYVHVPAAMLAQSLYIGMGVAGFAGLVWRVNDRWPLTCLPGYGDYRIGPVFRRRLGDHLGQLVGIR